MCVCACARMYIRSCNCSPSGGPCSGAGFARGTCFASQGECFCLRISPWAGPCYRPASDPGLGMASLGVRGLLLSGLGPCAARAPSQKRHTPGPTSQNAAMEAGQGQAQKPHPASAEGRDAAGAAASSFYCPCYPRKLEKAPAFDILTQGVACTLPCGFEIQRRRAGGGSLP